MFHGIAQLEMGEPARDEPLHQPGSAVQASGVHVGRTPYGVPEMTTREFVCHNCGGTFETERTDEDAWAEFVRDFPGEAAKVAAGIDKQAEICEGCYQKFTAWIGQQFRGLQL